MALVLLEEVTINPEVELPELTEDWEIDSWRVQQNLVHQDPGERNSDSTGDLPVGVWKSPAKVWVGGGLLQDWGTDCGSTCLGSFQGGYHINFSVSLITNCHKFEYLKPAQIYSLVFFEARNVQCIQQTHCAPAGFS